MADRRFGINDAIGMLRKEAEHRVAGLKADAERLEVHLLEAYAAAEPATSDPNKADIVHVFEVDNTGRSLYVGSSLELCAYGMPIGRTLVAPAISAGRYRAVLMLTKLPDEEPRR